jgi:phosphotransferase system  glucose/maltose/N-acetylglucosamine-specific IIC component
MRHARPTVVVNCSRTTLLVAVLICFALAAVLTVLFIWPGRARGISRVVTDAMQSGHEVPG